MGHNISKISGEIQEKREKEKKEKEQAQRFSSENMDALDKELNILLDSYSQQVQSSISTKGNNTKERRNFYVADFTDDAYYTEEHISPQGAFKDAPQRAMNISINEQQWLYDKTSCSQACKDHQFFGLQDVNSNGLSQCFCSDSWKETTKYGLDDCDSGGGPWCNYVYENVKPPPIPSSLHLGKLYYGEKGLNDKHYTIYEYPTNKIDFKGQGTNTSVNFFKVAGFDSSPGQNDMTHSSFPTMEEAKQYCLEIGAEGFVHDRTNNVYYYKSTIFPRAKKTPSESHDIYLVYPAIKDAEPCNKKVDIVSPNFIASNCVLKSGLPPSNVCDGLNANVEVGLGDINERLMSMGSSLATNMNKNMENAEKYNKEQPAQREKYNKTLEKYEKIINVIENRKTDIYTEDAISQDSIKNVKMRQMFIYFVLVIIGTIVIVYTFGFSKIAILVVLALYYVGLYVLIVSKDQP